MLLNAEKKKVFTLAFTLAQKQLNWMLVKLGKG